MSTSSDTPQTIYPALRYRDADAAIAFLETAFGFSEHAVHRSEAGRIEHAELKLGSSLIMLSEFREGGWLDVSNIDPMATPTTIYVAVDDADACHARAKAGGAPIIRELVDQEYGSRDFGARDIEGNIWWFGTYNPQAARAEPATA
jgi:uncharacterized glyoxalase superfamily protein PhnB